jgi:hypothetical protein
MAAQAQILSGAATNVKLPRPALPVPLPPGCAAASPLPCPQLHQQRMYVTMYEGFDEVRIKSLWASMKAQRYKLSAPDTCTRDGQRSCLNDVCRACKARDHLRSEPSESRCTDGTC